MIAPGAAMAQLVTNPATAQVSAGGATPIVTQSNGLTDITLGAPRTLLTWTTFNLAANEAVVYRFQDARGVVLNRVTGQAVIDGQVEALVGGVSGMGNVWFSAPGGVLFGPNARVDVGGLLATTAAVATSGFLDATSSQFSFTGGASSVQVAGGAQLKAASGGLALISSSVSTGNGAAVTSDGTVLYGATSDFNVRFSVQPGGLDLLDFVVPSGGGTASATPLSLQGQTVGANVFLAVVNRADIASAVINAPGLIAAQSANADQGDIVLSAGVDILNRQPGTVRGNASTGTTATFGVVSAQRDVLGGFSQPSAVSIAQIAAGRDVGFTAARLNFGGVNAGRLLVLDAAQGIGLAEGAAAGSATTLRSTQGAVTVGGGSGVISSVGRLQIDAGSVQAGQLNSSRSVVINAGGAGDNGFAVRVASIVAADDIGITTTHLTGGISLGSATLLGGRTDEAPLGRVLALTTRGAEADVSYGGATGAAVSGATVVSISAGRDLIGGLQAFGPTGGALSATRDLVVTFQGGLAPAGPVSFTAGRDLNVTVLGNLSPAGAASLSAGRDLTATIRGNASSSGATTLAATRDLTLTIQGNLNPGGVTSVTAGRDLAAAIQGNLSPTGATTLSAGGALTANVQGNLNPIGATTLSAGGGLTATVQGNLSPTGATILSAGSMLTASVMGALSPTGSATLTATTGNLTLTVQRDLSPTGAATLSSGANLTVTVQGAFNPGGAARLTAANDLTVTTLGAFNPASGATLTSLRDVTANVGGLLTLAGGSATRNFTIRAADLNLNGTLTAANLRVESTVGGLILGGATTSAAPSEGGTASADGDPVLRLTDAEFQRIQVSEQVSFYAGSTLGPARGALSVLDLRVNTARVPRLLLAAGVNSDILVSGILAPDTAGGVLTIGESAADSPWRPGRILVTGAIGFSTGSPDAGFSGVRPFDQVNLNAVRDVILGSSRFVALIAAAPPGTIDIENNQPAGVAPTGDEQDRVFLTSGRLSAQASERIVQQNSGTTVRPNGILITSATGGSASAESLSVAPARVVDLFGGFQGTGGFVRNGLVLTVGAGSTDGSQVRFNGCDFDAGACAAAEIAVTTRKVVQLEDLDLGEVASADAVSALPPEPPVLSFAEPEPDVIVTDPVMLGSGSAEIWRGKRQKKNQ